MTTRAKRLQRLRDNPQDCREDKLAAILEQFDAVEVNRKGAARSWKIDGRRLTFRVHGGRVRIRDVERALSLIPVPPTKE